MILWQDFPESLPLSALVLLFWVGASAGFSGFMLLSKSMLQKSQSLKEESKK